MKNIRRVLGFLNISETEEVDDDLGRVIAPNIPENVQPRRLKRGGCGRCGRNSNCTGCIDPDYQSIVIDDGSYMCKAGFGGDDTPRAVFPSIIGRPKNPVELDEKGFVGDEANAKRGILNISSPIERGIVKNWDEMEKIWRHTFYNELRVTPEEHPVLLTEPCLNLDYNREKMTSIMFETFNVPALYIESGACLSLYSSGRTTGTVLSCGDGFTVAVPMYEGYPIPHAIQKVNFGGSDITDYLTKVLKFDAPGVPKNVIRCLCRDIKETVCFVAEDFQSEMNKKEVESEYPPYELPDGAMMDTIGKERFIAPELLFNPNNSILEGKGEQPLPSLQELVVKAIKKSDEDMKSDLFKNIVLAGGCTLFDGIVERLNSEITKLAPEKYSRYEQFYRGIKVIAQTQREYSTWIGGSILCTLHEFKDKWITTGDYDEFGSTIIHRKCFGTGRLLETPQLQSDIHGDQKSRIEFLVEEIFVEEEYICCSVMFSKTGTTFFVPNILGKL